MATMVLTSGGDLYARFFIELGIVSTFDASSCAVNDFVGSLTASGGGGSTFDCYEDTASVTSLQQAGTGIGLWSLGDSPLGYIYGDQFNSYISESPITQSLNSGIQIGIWEHSDNTFGIVMGENFNDQPSEDPIVEVINGNLGGTGTWGHGDGP